MFKLIRATFLGLIGMAFALSAYADITFVSWGGAYTASQQKAYIDTWSKGSGVTVENYNCLLYTSPSPRDLSTSRMPSSA